MQIPIIAHRGQKKPWNSIPRLNWAHPLTKGMVFYGYDTGCGLVVELVYGLKSSLLNSPQPPPRPTAFGQGNKYVSGGGSANFPATTGTNAMLANHPYSIACAWYLTALPSLGFTGIFGMNETGSTTDNAILLFGTASNDVQWAVANNNPTPLAINTINQYHTFLGTNSNPTATAQNIYFDGKLAGTTAIAAAATTTAAQPIFNSNSGGAGAGNGVNGWVYYGIVWNRTISAAEARKLHDDPYCFLIYPEDEMGATLVGATATPGPGPNFLTSLLPMMGVG
jgi:hypothetical protein